MLNWITQYVDNIGIENSRSVYLRESATDENGRRFSDRAGEKVVAHLINLENKHRMLAHLFCLVKTSQTILTEPRELDMIKHHERIIRALISSIDRYMLSLELVEPEEIADNGLMEIGEKLVAHAARYCRSWQQMKLVIEGTEK